MTKSNAGRMAKQAAKLGKTLMARAMHYAQGMTALRSSDSGDVASVSASAKEKALRLLYRTLTLQRILKEVAITIPDEYLQLLGEICLSLPSPNF